MRQIYIIIDTTLNYCEVADFNAATGAIHYNVVQALGFGWTYERQNAAIPLTDPFALIKIKGLTGETGFFTIGEVGGLVIDGTPTPCADLDALVVVIAPYLFS
jgi:hypothetical protein